MPLYRMYTLSPGLYYDEEAYFGGWETDDIEDLDSSTPKCDGEPPRLAWKYAFPCESEAGSVGKTDTPVNNLKSLHDVNTGTGCY